MAKAVEMYRLIELGVNVDHVATLREARGTGYPDPVQAARVAEDAGADSITAHLREDRRHIQERDIERLREVLQTRLNLEMAATPGLVDFACGLRPQACCLVPERRAELTTEGGLDAQAQRATLAPLCARLATAGVRVALFIDPEAAQIEAAAALGVPTVELHTGRYADAADASGRARELERLRQAARRAVSCGLEVHAGHGLNYHNVVPVAAITELTELNIGHSIIARAVFSGLAEAVREMRRILGEARAA
ncbi:MAG: pyridoxine 5'-phosphate synthase [Gammaproteobacteria bacterium]